MNTCGLQRVIQNRERISTHVAVAANISCLLAFVHTLNAAANSNVNTNMRLIFSELFPVTKNSTADGPTNKPTVMRTRTRRTTRSMRRLLQRRRCSSSVRLESADEVKNFYDRLEELRRLDCCGFKGQMVAYSH